MGATSYRVALIAVASGLAMGLSLFAQEPADAPPQSPPANPPVAVAADGATLFHERGCEYCHGADAAGTEKGPSLRRVRLRLKKPAIAQQIHDGGGGMPPFGEALNAEEIDNLVKYLETLKPLPHTSGHKSTAAPKPAATPEEQLAVFLSPMPEVQP